MRNVSMPASLWQPQKTQYTKAILNLHFSNLNYLLAPKTMASSPDRVYSTNRELWEAIISEKLRAYCHLSLDGFYLFEWFPRSPGLYYTHRAKNAQWLAFSHIDDRFLPAHMKESAHVVRPDERSDHRIVFTPKEKALCLRASG